MKYLKITSILLISFFIFGCSIRPDKEIRNTQRVFVNFIESDIYKKNPEEYTDIVNLKNKLKGELESQDARFAMFRAYGCSKRLCDSLIYLCRNSVPSTGKGW